MQHTKPFELSPRKHNQFLSQRNHVWKPEQKKKSFYLEAVGYVAGYDFQKLLFLDVWHVFFPTFYIRLTMMWKERPRSIDGNLAAV